MSESEASTSANNAPRWHTGCTHPGEDSNAPVSPRQPNRPADHPRTATPDAVGKAGMTCEQTADTIYASAWTLRRMEKTEVASSSTTLRACSWPTASPTSATSTPSWDLARGANKPGWWA